MRKSDPNTPGYDIHKVIFIEVKRYQAIQPGIWQQRLPQLQDYMLGLRDENGNIQDMYGVLAIGMFRGPPIPRELLTDFSHACLSESFTHRDK
jgi:hypothetical protein